MGRLWELVEGLDVKRAKAPATTVVESGKVTDPPTLPAEDPKVRLWLYLDTWSGMDEPTWPEANVKALYDDIMDVFRDYSEAGGWYRAWRSAHPGARPA